MAKKPDNPTSRSFDAIVSKVIVLQLACILVEFSTGLVDEYWNEVRNAEHLSHVDFFAGM